jgi:phosphoribosylanthranilate isomerase
VSLGAAAIGFVFWPKSPRFIEAARAREIVDRLSPFVTTVGVFVNQSAAEVNATSDAARIQVVQLHGDETPAFAAAIRRPIVKAISAENAAREWAPDVTLLLDAHDDERRGGTGERSDWDAARRLASRRAVLLAGGLTPENIGDAMARVQPYGVDVSSGVETSPGIKDPKRLAALFNAIRASEHQPARS